MELVQGLMDMQRLDLVQVLFPSPTRLQRIAISIAVFSQGLHWSHPFEPGIVTLSVYWGQSSGIEAGAGVSGIPSPVAPQPASDLASLGSTVSPTSDLSLPTLAVSNSSVLRIKAPTSWLCDQPQDFLCLQPSYSQHVSAWTCTPRPHLNTS